MLNIYSGDLLKESEHKWLVSNIENYRVAVVKGYATEDYIRKIQGRK